MFRKTIVITSLILSLCAAGCGTAKAAASQDLSKPAVQNEEAAPASAGGLLTVDVDTLTESAGTPILGYKDNTSASTVIVAVDSETVNPEVIASLCEKYRLTVLYDYESLSMYALSTVDTLSPEAFDEMIEKLSAEKGILSVEKDQMLGLDLSNQ
ncbi:MAG: hypothetical protein J6Z46_03455 [Lachnospiraceae bacterium]|nr:hypothetical protein [Lachnospiraceae bacterium]